MSKILITAKMERQLAQLEAKISQVSKPKHKSPLSLAFNKQLNLINDSSRWKFAITTRRAAKTYAAILNAFNICLKSNLNVIYVSMIAKTIRESMWRDIAHKIDEDLDLGLKFNESEMSIEFSTGAHFYTYAIDAAEHIKKRLRGGKYKLAIVDEIQDISIDLAELVEQILQPTTFDNSGTILLLGTPGKIKEGYWWEVTQGIRKGWSGHTWSGLDNPHINYAQQLDELKKVSPGIELTNGFKREFLGEWAIDDTELQFNYKPGFNDFSGNLPIFTPHKFNRWHYVLGIDLGLRDDTALVTMAYHDNSDILYILAAESHKGLDVTSTANKIHTITDVIGFDDLVIDPASAQVISELENRFNLVLTKANKPGRDHQIEILNDALIQGKIKINPITCQSLVHELKNLLRGQETNDHCIDALRYGFWQCREFWDEPSPPIPAKQGTPEYNKQQEDLMRNWALDEIERVQTQKQEEAFWNEGLAPELSDFNGDE